MLKKPLYFLLSNFCLCCLRTLHQFVLSLCYQCLHCRTIKLCFLCFICLFCFKVGFFSKFLNKIRIFKVPEVRKRAVAEEKVPAVVPKPKEPIPTKGTDICLFNHPKDLIFLIISKIFYNT